MNVPFSPPDISEEEIKGVVDTLRFWLDYDRTKNKRI